jgi:hypothetical protein
MELKSQKLKQCNHISRVFIYHSKNEPPSKICKRCNKVLGEGDHPLLLKARHFISYLMRKMYKLNRSEASFIYTIRHKKVSHLTWNEVQKLKVIYLAYCEHQEKKICKEKDKLPDERQSW